MTPTSRVLIAGAGASALNADTCLDMALRARLANSAGEDSAGRLADLVPHLAYGAMTAVALKASR